MPAAEHQRPGAVEGIEQRQPVPAAHAGQQRQPDEQQREDGKADRSLKRTEGKPHVASRRRHAIPAPQQSGKAPEQDRRHLPRRTAQHDRHRHGHEGDARPLAIGREALRHAPYRLRHHRDGHQLEAAQDALGHRPVKRGRAESEGHQQRGGRQRETRPRSQRTQRPGPPQPQRETCLARCRPRQELAQRHQVGIFGLAQPAAAQHELGAEIAQMRDGAAKGGQSQLEEGEKHLPRRAGLA